MTCYYKKTGLLLFVTLIAAGCSFAPLTPRVDAASVGKHKVKIESNLSPATYLSIIYGAGEHVDVGIDVEQLTMTTAWSRYSFVNNPNGLSVAGTGGVFVADGDNKSNGWYAGLLMSNQFEPNIRWTAGLRYAVLDYQYGRDEEGWFSATIDFDNPDDAAENIQADLNLSWFVKPHVEFSLGATCQYLPKNKDLDQSNQLCIPLIGFSFYRK